MHALWFLKWPLIVFLAGFLVRLTGLLFKVRHWPMADELITTGSIICDIGIAYAIFKIAFMKKPGTPQP